MSRRSTAGLTLMEVLVAVSLVSLLSVGILFSIRIALNAMEKTNRKLSANRRVLSAQRILEQQIAGFMPVPAERSPMPGGPVDRMSFFQGEPAAMRFVSTYSLAEASRGYPRILEFQVIPREEGGGVRLVVNERLYTGPRSAGAFCLGFAPDPVRGVAVPRFRQIEIGAYSFVLADRLAFCRFSYQEQMPLPQVARWVELWINPLLPTAIRVEMGPLAQDSSKIQPLTLTAPLRVNRVVLGLYAP